MTRQNKNKPNVADAFNRSAKPQSVETIDETIETTQVDMTEKPQDAPQEVSEVTVDESSPLTVEQVAKDILSQYEEKRNKKTVEETHTRTTFLLENTLLDRLNQLTVDKKKKGLKTKILNDAVRVMLDQLDKK